MNETTTVRSPVWESIQKLLSASWMDWAAAKALIPHLAPGEPYDLLSWLFREKLVTEEDPLRYASLGLDLFTDVEFTAEETCRLVEMYGQVVFNGGKGQTSAKEHVARIWEVGFCHLLSNPSLSTSELGTMVRSLFLHGWQDRDLASGNITTFLLPNPSVPVEVMARFRRFDQSFFPHARGSAHESWRAAVKETYPDLVGLPDDLVADVISGEPIPDAWFLNAWTVPTLDSRFLFGLPSVRASTPKTLPDELLAVFAFRQ